MKTTALAHANLGTALKELVLYSSCRFLCLSLNLSVGVLGCSISVVSLCVFLGAEFAQLSFSGSANQHQVERWMRLFICENAK